MHIHEKYNALDQTAGEFIGDSLGCKMCNYVLVILDTPVSAPEIIIKGNTDNLTDVILHTESAIAANKTVRLDNAGAFTSIYAELTNAAGDKCKVELIAVWLG